LIEEETRRERERETFTKRKEKTEEREEPLCLVSLRTREEGEQACPPFFTNKSR
jgi:hypothetical protein